MNRNFERQVLRTEGPEGDIPYGLECSPQRHGGTQRVDLESIENCVLLCVSLVLLLGPTTKFDRYKSLSLKGS